MKRITFLAVSLSALSLIAAPRNRITRTIDSRQMRQLGTGRHPLARQEFDLGPVDAGMKLAFVSMVVPPSAAQQADLDQLLLDQQNPSSTNYRKWLTPEEYAGRFGLSSGDAGKIAAWLRSEGLTVEQSGRGRNWIAFSGTAGQMSKTFRMPIHRYRVDGEMHYANAEAPSVPEALADIVGGFAGMDDFKLQSQAHQVAEPDFNSGSSHYLAPEDFATIYNLGPLYSAGFDGTGQDIVIVGQTALNMPDLRAFRTRFNLPARDPAVFFYGGTDPGVTGDLGEADLDLEWAGAIAPKANITYVYGTNAFTAMIAAISLNIAPVISASYGACEVNAAPAAYRSITQQANAQGITIFASSGDAGAAGCDRQGSETIATRGHMAHFPAVLPEVTAVGGTQFVEGTGAYWKTTNTANSGSVLSYIPEAVWNESSSAGLLATGGAPSTVYPKPTWQSGPGVPDDHARDVPDVSLSAAGHDAYLVVYQGVLSASYGTSASAPSMAGIFAILNQYQVAKGFQRQAGLGNVNPQLYRLAQSAPAVFHDITAGDNIVHCAQGSPDCTQGWFGQAAGPGYDVATGLGSVDANNLVTMWNTASKRITMNLFLDSTRPLVNDTIGATAIVAPADGNGAPTGRVDFFSGTLPLGSADVITRNGQQVADLFFPAYLLGGTGSFAVGAIYSGDAAFSSGGTVKTVTVSAGTNLGAAAIIPSPPSSIFGQPRDVQGYAWQTTLSLREVAGVPAMIGTFAIDGVNQPLSQYFPSPNIAANGSVSTTVVFRNIDTPVTRTFTFTGWDAGGHTWSRAVPVTYLPQGVGANVNVRATPVVAQNAADPNCPWPVQVNLDEVGGYYHLITSLFTDNVSLTSQTASIFGTTRLDAWGSLQGRICFSGIKPPATTVLFLAFSTGITHEVTVTFAGPAASPVKITPSPATVSLSDQAAAASLKVDMDKTAAWTASVYPANRTTSWLSVSKLSGVGPGQIDLTAMGKGFQPGAYRALIVLQSEAAIPQTVTVPVIFELGKTANSPSITRVGNAASLVSPGSPGMLLSVFGTKLADTTATAPSTSPADFSLAGVSATVNGLAAPVLYTSPEQLNILIPFEVGAGPAVVNVDNHGQAGGFLFNVVPASPGIFVDADGNVVGNSSAKRGDNATLYFTGAGEVTPALKTFYSPTAASLPKPVQAASVTVGGVPAFIQFVGHVAGKFGLMQLNLIVPDSVPAGPQPVVVTIGGVSSPAATINVQ